MENSEDKSPEEASNTFHNIMKASVSSKPDSNEPMIKSKWEEAKAEFEKAYIEISREVKKAKDGKNKKIRDTAEEELKYCRHNLEYLLIKKYPETYTLFVGGESGAHAAANFT